MTNEQIQARLDKFGYNLKQIGVGTYIITDCNGWNVHNELRFFPSGIDWKEVLIISLEHLVECLMDGETF